MEQAAKNTYDLEANLAALKLYQFNPNLLNMDITYTILLKALTNLPHTDFTLCKCLMLPAQMEDETVQEIINFASVLESCNFALFWDLIEHKKQLVLGVHGFFDSIRKFVCHVVGITFQSIEKEYLAQLLGGIDSEFPSNHNMCSLINVIRFLCRPNAEQLGEEVRLEVRRRSGLHRQPGRQHQDQEHHREDRIRQSGRTHDQLLVNRVFHGCLTVNMLTIKLIEIETPMPLLSRGVMVLFFVLTKITIFV